MKLNPNFIIQEIEDAQFLIPIESKEFHGIVKYNKTAAFVVNCLKEDTTKEAILSAMCDQYDAPKETLAAGLEATLTKLREVGALEE